MTATTIQQTPTATARRNTATAATADGGAGGTVFDRPVGVVDAATHAGLRLALGVIGQEGWEGPAGRAVLTALRARCRSWAAQRAAASHVGRGGVDAGEVLSLGWLTLARFGSQVAAAEAPWAYLWTSVQHALAVEIGASEVLSRKAVDRPATQWPRTALRSGLDVFGELGAEGDDDAWPGGGRLRARRAVAALAAAEPGQDAPAGPSRAVAALVGHLTRGQDHAREFWTEVVEYALEVMAGARRSYEEVTLRADSYLTHVLGLNGQQVGALAALLIGPRRGDRAAQCLLLALRADPDTDPATVPGAPTRIRLLTARRPHTGPAGLSVAA